MSIKWLIALHTITTAAPEAILVLGLLLHVAVS